MIESRSFTIPHVAPPMPMLPARGYESPHTKFMRELMEKRPELERKQREGRAMWWDKDPGDLADQRRMAEGRVAQKPYVYYELAKPAASEPQPDAMKDEG
jgi:hypothetical protein